jgi:hypothetical protein
MSLNGTAAHGTGLAAAFRTTVRRHGKRNVKMDALAALAFALAAGLTFCGLAGTIIELVSGRRLSLGKPLVSVANLSRSMVLVLLAGPFMTVNEALAAVRERRIGLLVFTGIAGLVLLWLMAVGVFVLGLVEAAGDPVG